MSGFSFGHILCDLLGLLILAAGVKFAILHGLVIKRRGSSARSLLCLLGNLSLAGSGLVLLLERASARTALWAGVLVLGAVLCAFAAYRVQSLHKENHRT